eukprot:PhM_4_TR7782/c0_g1_i1/m.50088/K05658/ABCB1, CD243; ATP-binding cassette, subfamily B (MDR/TAP), member 1
MSRSSSSSSSSIFQVGSYRPVFITSAVYVAIALHSIWRWQRARARRLPGVQYWAGRYVRDECRRLLRDFEAELGADAASVPLEKLGDLFTIANKFSLARVDGVVSPLEDLARRVVAARLASAMCNQEGDDGYRDANLLSTLISTLRRCKLTRYASRDQLRNAERQVRRSRSSTISCVARITSTLHGARRRLFLAALISPLGFRAVEYAVGGSQGSLTLVVNNEFLWDHLESTATTAASLFVELLRHCLRVYVRSLATVPKKLLHTRLSRAVQSEMEFAVLMKLATADLDYLDALRGSNALSDGLSAGAISTSTTTCLGAMDSLTDAIGDIVLSASTLHRHFQRHGFLYLVYVAATYGGARISQKMWELSDYLSGVMNTAAVSEAALPRPVAAHALMHVAAMGHEDALIGLSLLIGEVHETPESMTTEDINVVIDVVTTSLLPLPGFTGSKPRSDLDAVVSMWRASSTNDTTKGRKGPVAMCYPPVRVVAEAFSRDTFPTLRTLGCDVSTVSYLHDKWRRADIAEEENVPRFVIAGVVENGPLRTLLRDSVPHALGGYLLSKNVGSCGEVKESALSVLEEQTSSLMWSVSGVVTELKDADTTGPVNMLANVLEYTPTIDAGGCQEKAEVFEGKIEFRDVWFKYPSAVKAKLVDDDVDEDDGSSWVLRGVSLVIPARQFVGIVGASGNGKSTLLALIMRLYVPTRGEILIDDRPIESYDVTWLRRSVLSYVPSTCTLLEGTVEANLMLADPRLPHDAVVNAAKRAHIHHVIQSKQDGYATRVRTGNTGCGFSGGELQRLVTARGLAVETPILLLDEYTNALDAHSEQIVEDAMTRCYLGKRTLLVVAHRLRTLRHAHRIVVLDKGRVIEDGTWSELAALDGGTFRRLVELQTLHSAGHHESAEQEQEEEAEEIVEEEEVMTFDDDGDGVDIQHILAQISAAEGSAAASSSRSFTSASARVRDQLKQHLIDVYPELFISGFGDDNKEDSVGHTIVEMIDNLDNK